MSKVPGLALIGVVVGAGIQPLTPTGWWLNSGRGVALTVSVLTGAALVVGLRGFAWPAGRAEAMAAAALWAGINVGMAAVLFSAGPGTIFPIVLAVGAAISALAVSAGVLAGARLARTRRGG
jgi:hypothetical protein